MLHFPIKFYGISLVIFCFGMVGCVSQQSFMASEVLRVQFERENKRLIQDTTLQGLMYRNSQKRAQELMDSVSRLNIDTANMGKQIREYRKYIDYTQHSLIEKQGKALESEGRLDKKEAAPLPIPLVELDTKMSELHMVCKKELGAYAVDRVMIASQKSRIEISIPNYLLFDNQSASVLGKGVALLIKISDVLKKYPNPMTVWSCAMPDTRISSTEMDLWDLATKRSSAILQILQRYGQPSRSLSSSASVLPSGSPSTDLVSRLYIYP